jgi:Methyltransferase domain
MSLKEISKAWMARNLPPSVSKRLKHTIRDIVVWWYRDDLNRLGVLCGTDKWGSHWYTPHYDHYFRSLRHRRLNVLEIGVGGYEHSHTGGESLHMWKAYFQKSRIVGIDLYDKTCLSEHRIDVRQCDQTDKERLVSLSQEYGGFDIIVDDGSHLNEHVIQTFEILFPLLRPNGIYVVEDMQTAYWPTWGGGMKSPKSSITYFKNMVDCLNHAEYPIADYQPTYFDQNVVGVSFFHNMVFIEKGKNNEGTNLPRLLEHELASMSSGNSGA